jgi:flagellar motor switch protein FliM
MNQILDQDEINALLAGISDGDIAPAEDDGVQAGPAAPTRPYDLASQERIIRGRMPAMELIHDRFARGFRSAFSKFLGRSVFVNVGAIEIIKFGAFVKRLPMPSSLHVYRMPPLNGYALMAVSAPLVFSVVDTLFGGKGISNVKIEGREYTPIESRLVNKVVLMALENLTEAWAPIHPVEFTYVRSEINPLAAAIVQSTDVVIIVTVEIELEQESTTLTICTPYHTLEPLRQKLSSGFQNTRLESSDLGSKRMRYNVSQTDIHLTVELAKGTATARQLSNLKIGDILPLETSPSDEAIVRVEGVPKYKGFVGTYRGSRAVKLTRAIPIQRLMD